MWQVDLAARTKRVEAQRKKILQKKPKLFIFMAKGFKRKRPTKTESEVDSYLGEEILHFDEDPLMQWFPNCGTRTTSGTRRSSRWYVNTTCFSFTT